MTKTFFIKKLTHCPTNKKTNKLEITIELKEKEKGKPCFSASCDLWDCTNTEIIMGGQIFDSILKSYPELKDDETFMTIYELWNKHHLNDMDASANDEQRKAVDTYCRKHGGYNYDGVCNFLKKKKLYSVVVDGVKCKYGEAWYYRPIPENDLKKILELFK